MTELSQTRRRVADPTGTFLAHVQVRRAALRANVADAFRELGTVRERVLELGCGHGHFLAAYAAAHGAIGCVGIDRGADRIRRAERKRQRQALGNLRFLRADALEFFEVLPREVRFSRVFVLFPDPWPKRRHQKHRMVQPDFLSRLAGACEGGAALFFRSDSTDYARETRLMLQQHPDWRLAPEYAWPFEFATVFQDKCASFESLVAIKTC